MDPDGKLAKDQSSNHNNVNLRRKQGDEAGAGEALFPPAEGSPANISRGEAESENLLGSLTRFYIPDQLRHQSSAFLYLLQVFRVCP